MRDPAQLDIDPADFIPKAISFGLLAQFVIGIGISGSIGFIENLDIANSQSAVYGGGALDVGIDAGIEGDVCLGFWTNEVSDISGLYVGGEVDVDDGTGVTVATFFKGEDEDPGLAFVGVDLGVDDGIEEEDFYFFHIDTGSNPIYQPGEATYLIQLLWLTCNNSKDNYDTVKFTFQQDPDPNQTPVTYHFPAWDGFQMAESGNDSAVSTWNVGAILKFNTSLALTLQVGGTDMGAQTIKASDFSKVFEVITLPSWDVHYGVLGVDEIKYTLTYQFIKG